METDCCTGNMMDQRSKKSQNKEDNQTAAKERGLLLDQLKEDGIRKELYKKERKVQQYWGKKWGFLLKSEKLQQKEAAKECLEHEIIEMKRNHQITSTRAQGRKPAMELLPSKRLPLKSSEIIGWRLFTKRNELDRLMGPMYLSPKLTANPPPSPDEPDSKQQNVIYLG